MAALAAVSAVTPPAARPAFTALSLSGRAAFSPLPLPGSAPFTALAAEPITGTLLFLSNGLIPSPPSPLAGCLRDRVDELRLGHGLALDADAAGKLDEILLLVRLQAAVGRLPLELSSGVPSGCGGVLAKHLGRLDPGIRLARLMLRLLGELLGLAVGLLGGGARGLGGLVRQSLGLCQLPRSVLDELFGVRLGLLGLSLSFLHLLVDLRLHLLALLLGLLLGGLTLSLHRLVRGLPGGGDALPELPSRLVLHVR